MKTSKSIPPPALAVLTVHAAQLYLTYLGFHQGPIDGLAGTRSRHTVILPGAIMPCRPIVAEARIV
jgi:hypothetical protein